MRTATLAFVFTSLILIGTSAGASPLGSATTFLTAAPAHDPWHIDWLSGTGEQTPIMPAPSLALRASVLRQNDNQPVHAAAVEHSDGYLMRAKIHRYASWATLPLFATELALGQSLYNGTDSGWKKGMHGAVGASIVGLFAVNTVTGVWNLFGESWNDPGRGMRLVHGLLMLAADAGFAATSMSTPEHERGLRFTSDRSTHRNLAIASIGLGTAGYLLMLIGSH